MIRQCLQYTPIYIGGVNSITRKEHVPVGGDDTLGFEAQPRSGRGNEDWMFFSKQTARGGAHHVLQLFALQTVQDDSLGSEPASPDDASEILQVLATIWRLTL